MDAQVTVLMPMKNAAPFVADAIHSVLNETKVALELIIINNGSTDNSREIVTAIKDSRIIILDAPQIGISECLNLGLEKATGNLVMKCDADDLFAFNKIEMQTNWFRDNPEYIAVCGGYEMMGRTGEIISRPFNYNSTDMLDISEELNNGILRTSLCTFCIRRDAINIIGGFRPYFETAEDIDFAFRLGQTGKVAFIPNCVYQYRIHNESITHTQPSPRRVFFEEAAKLFAFERRTSGADALAKGIPPLPPMNSSNATNAEQHVHALLVGEAWRRYKNNDLKAALRTCGQLIAGHPNKLLTWKTVFKILTKSFLHLLSKK